MKNEMTFQGKGRWVLFSLFAAFFYLAIYSCGDTPTAKTDIEKGHDLYIAYCDFCHGEYGDGGVADMLKVPPPDLTKISQRRNGVFPDEEIYKIIDGTEAIESGHGNRDMPIWGQTLGKAERVDEVMVPKKIYELIEYLKSIQR